jgi:hypothetical protein
MINRSMAAGLGLMIAALVAAPAVQAQMFVYPEKGQTPDLQEQDEFACHKWAKQQTGFDPNEHTAAAAPPPPQKGGALSGAAGGAALGAIGGAIAGDAGKGAAIGAATGGTMGMMRRRRGEMQYRQAQEQAQAQQQQARQTFNRAYSTCLSARGYKVG